MWEDELAEEMRSGAPSIFWDENFVPDASICLFVGKYLNICAYISTYLPTYSNILTLQDDEQKERKKEGEDAAVAAATPVRIRLSPLLLVCLPY